MHAVVATEKTARKIYIQVDLSRSLCLEQMNFLPALAWAESAPHATGWRPGRAVPVRAQRVTGIDSRDATGWRPGSKRLTA